MSSFVNKTNIKTTQKYVFDDDDFFVSPSNNTTKSPLIKNGHKVKISSPDKDLEKSKQQYKTRTFFDIDSNSNANAKSNKQVIVNVPINTPQKNDPITNTFNKYYFGKTIKPLQYDIVNSIVKKKDTIGILPTGYGKSVCYQLPYLLNPNNVVIVISPLISLMEDQKDKLEKLNIPVACFHSNKTKKQKQMIKNELLQNMLNDENNEWSDDESQFEKSKTKTKSVKTTSIKTTSIKTKSAKNNSLSDDNDLLYDESADLTESSESSLSKATGMIVFFTPEYLLNCEHWLKRLANANKLALIALDEAHCISTWGHDFRPDYQGVYRIKEWVPNVPILALTATATKQVEEYIKTYGELGDPNIYKTSFDRPNLIINIRSRPKELNVIWPILDKYKNDYSIIYCKTRDRAETVCKTLQENNYNADVYHAGLSANKRLEIQEKFANKELNIIVATVAFGMGIDQNIHLVIHWGCPSDMESYYQEIGRAGRDGIDSECFLFYDREDFRISRHFLKTITDTDYKRFKDEQIGKMERFCMQPNCRRKIILGHFGENVPVGYVCNKCDNCNKQKNVNNIAMDNLMYPMFIIIKTIFFIKCKLGLSKLIMVLKGSKAKIISEFNKSPTFGLLKNLSDDQIKNLVNILIISGYLREKALSNNFGGTILETTSKVVTWYTNVNKQIGNKLLTFDNCCQTLNVQSNKLTLSVPVEYNDSIMNIKYKSTIETMVNEFADEFVDI